MQERPWDLHKETFPNEIKLLMLCTSKNISGEQQEQVRALVKDGIDWQLFLKAVKKHRVFPIVYYNLKKMDGLSVNQNFLHKLELLCQRNLINSVKMTAELVKVNRLMTDHGIRTFSLKGPVLGMALYDDVALRNTGDLDILADINDLDKIERLMIEAGFVLLDEKAMSTPKRKAKYMQIKHHLIFKKPAGIIIEIHWRYSIQSDDQPFNYLWDQRRVVVVSGQEIAVLSHEDEFIFLVTHGGKHGWTRLRWLCDITEIIKLGQLNWHEVIVKAEKSDAMELVAQAIILANQLFDIEIPAEILPVVAGQKLGQKLARMAIPLLLEYDGRLTEPGHPQYQYYKKYTFARSKGMKRKLAYLTFQFNPQPVDYETVNLRDRYFFMYYLMRPYFKIKRM